MTTTEESTAINRIGLRRLFDAKGCSLTVHEEIVVDLTVSESFQARIYLGPKPEHGIQVVSGIPRYMVPGEPFNISNFEFNADATKSSYAGRFFLEISASCAAEPIDSAVGSEDIRSKLLKQAEAKKPELQNIIDLVAGIVGLRFHRQFVLVPLDENIFAWEGEIPVRAFVSPSWEILETIGLTEAGVAHLEGHRAALQNLPDTLRRKLGLIFHWLLRAWREVDHVYKFVALFLPLEAVLSSGGKKRDSQQKEQVDAIRRILRDNAGEQAESLVMLFNRAYERLSPTLDDRFIDLARNAQMPGWEGDIEAFRHFKRLRNALVHRGDKEVQHRLTVGQEEVRTLSDLVERYVNYAIFGDSQVYESRSRPKAQEQSKGADT